MAVLIAWLLPQHTPASAVPAHWDAGISAEAGPSSGPESPYAHLPPPQVGAQRVSFLIGLIRSGRRKSIQV